LHLNFVVAKFNVIIEEEKRDMIALIYGSTTGNTADIASRVQNVIGEENIELFDVESAGLAALAYFENIIFAIPTWDYGEVQSDWLDVWDEIDEADLSGKTVAFIGVGDQFAYAEWFLDAMGLLHDKVVARGARPIGYWPTAGYDYEASKAVTEDGKFFVGLGLDEDCQPEMTDRRIAEWCAEILRQMNKVA
jgi:flavodoxin long chain